MKLSREDQIAGCLLGGALGDAVGSCFEGSEPSTEFTLPDDLVVTDDTQLTLATCEAIPTSGFVSPEGVANRFVKWHRERRLTGIGVSTFKALTELDAGGHWALVGATGERSAGNGAAMRIAPLAFFLDPGIDADRQVIRDVCRITHRNDEAYIGALAILHSIRYVCKHGELDPSLLALLLDSLPDSRVRDRLLAIQKTALSLEQYAIRFAASGYVVDSVPLAILAAIQAKDALESIRQILRLGGDTDTNASMFGQVFGAANGPSAFPNELIARIDVIEMVRQSAEKLAVLAEGK